MSGFRQSAACLWAAFVFLVVPPSMAVEDASRFNELFGLPLFGQLPFWEEEAQSVASRLLWPEESRTSTEESFRKYPSADQRMFGCRPHSLLLHAEDGTPSSLSLVFANKGDSVNPVNPIADSGELRERREQLRHYKRDIQRDKQTLEKALTDLFGPPRPTQFGQGAKTKESAKRWDSHGTAFLLAAPRDEYVVLRIMPVDSADAGGRSRVSDQEIRVRVAGRVERRENGDVILRDMPMVNQGPKGYCVPATWERVLRYMGVPADMYVLAMAGQTQEGGGTSMTAIQEGVHQAVVRAGRRIESPRLRLETVEVARYIDRGLPVMWAMFSTEEFNEVVTLRSQQRREMKDPAEWKKLLSNSRRDGKNKRPTTDTGHVCMIIGYNKKTGEIAITDSWGPAYAERWATLEEARTVSQGHFQVINF